MALKQLLLILSVVLIVGGCRKSDRDLDTDTTGAADLATAETAVANVFKEVHKVIIKRIELNKQAALSDTARGSCPKVTMNPFYPDTVNFPKIIVIDYGNTGCSVNGVNFKGHITAVVTGYYKTPGTFVTLSFGNLFINDLAFKGEVVYKTLDSLANGNIRFSADVKDVTLTDSKQRAITINYKRNYEWTEGRLTPGNTDDGFSITGKATGYALSGATLTATITDALKIKTSCGYISSGIESLQQGNLTERELNYGTGCDASVNVKWSGNDFPVTIK